MTRSQDLPRFKPLWVSMRGPFLSSGSRPRPSGRIRLVFWIHLCRDRFADAADGNAAAAVIVVIGLCYPPIHDHPNFMWHFRHLRLRQDFDTSIAACLPSVDNGITCNHVIFMNWRLPNALNINNHIQLSTSLAVRSPSSILSSTYMLS